MKTEKRMPWSSDIANHPDSPLINYYTGGRCQDGAALLKDGQPLTIEEILTQLAARDALVELNKELVEALEDVASSAHTVRIDGVDITISSNTADKVIVALTKAKELLEGQGE